MDREACATVLCNPGEAQSLCLSLLLLGPLHSRLNSRCLSPLLVHGKCAMNALVLMHRSSRWALLVWRCGGTGQKCLPLLL